MKKVTSNQLMLTIAGGTLAAFGVHQAAAQQVANSALTNTSQIDATGTILGAAYINTSASTAAIQFNGGNANAGAGVTFDPSASPVNGYGFGAYPYPAVSLANYPGVTFGYTRNQTATNGFGGQAETWTGGTASTVPGTDAADADTMLNGDLLFAGGGGAGVGMTGTFSLTGLPDSATVKVQLFSYGSAGTVSPGPTITGNTGLMGTWSNNQPGNYSTTEGGYYEYMDTTSPTGTLSIQMTSDPAASEYDGAYLAGLIVSQAASAPVPEPASLSLLGLATAGLMTRRVRRR